MENELYDWPCQDLHGGRGSGIYNNIDGRCQHPECHPRNDDRNSKTPKGGAVAMIPFTDLAKQVKALHDKLGIYVTACADCTAFQNGVEINYRYYDENNGWSIRFSTVQELQTHMNNILNPPTDEGVSV
jgi:hypothetical protein